MVGNTTRYIYTLCADVSAFNCLTTLTFTEMHLKKITSQHTPGTVLVVIDMQTLQSALLKWQPGWQAEKPGQHGGAVSQTARCGRYSPFYCTKG